MGARLSYPEADQSGKVAVVTGGNTGIGYETAKGLALLGARVIMACRSEERAKGAIERMHVEVAEEYPDKTISVEFMSLDLASLQSVKKFIEDYKQKERSLHLLINNAGIAIVTEGKTEDGFERHFQVNHLGHFYLTLELLPIILSSAPSARIVFVSSDAHRIAFSFDPDNLEGQKGYDRMKQYGSSKLFNIMTGAAIQRRVVGHGLTVSAVHPGIVDTEIERNFGGHFTVQFINVVARLTGNMRDAKKGAATTLYAAVHPDLNKEEFQYYASCKPSYMTAEARNEQFQEQLWSISCDVLKDYLSPSALEEFGPKVSGSIPKVTVQEQDTPTEIVQEQDTPTEIVQERGTPTEIVQERSTPTETVQKQDTPTETVQEQDTPTETVQEQNTPTETVQKQDTPTETVQEQDTPTETVQEQDTPTETVQEQDTPTETVQEQDTPTETVQDQDTPTETVQT